MGGIIEDKIFEVLMGNKMNAREIHSGLDAIGYERTYKVLTRHLRKMSAIKQLEREINSKQHVYWNPAMVGRKP